jgi:3-phosphoshikimate 1-carboxyvinyltransferase
MDIKVWPGRLSGKVKAPPSKSMAHRAIICASLAGGKSVIRGISGSKDMEATIGCMQALGADIKRINDDRDVEITGVEGRTAKQRPLLDCIESGSTLRFVLPIAAALGAACDFTGRGKLPERPMTPLADEMKKKGVTFNPDGRDSLPFSIEGKLRSGIYSIPGNISSQYISGLIFALPLLDADSEIHITGNLESAGYIALTLQMVRDFGIVIEETDYGFRVPGNQKYRSVDAEVEGDYSNAAFWMAAAACGSDLEITGLRADSVQGDRKAADILEESGADVKCVKDSDGNNCSFIIDGSSMKGIDVECRDIPDIVPILSVAAAKAEGTTRFLDAGRLRIKESDRLAAMADCLGRLGAVVEEHEEELIVTGGTLKGGCEVSGYNDHRIVMSMAVAALICEEPLIIRGAEAVSKSYPDFFEEYVRLGGRADVITDR